MKTKLMIISILTAACMVVFSTATWAESKKNRRTKNPKQTHATVAKHAKGFHHQNQGKQSSRYRDKNHPYQQRIQHRDRYHRPGSHHRYYRHKPNHRLFHKYGWYYKPQHKYHRPVKKYHRKGHHRPIFSRNDGNVSVLASTSRRGWSIKISGRD